MTQIDLKMSMEYQSSVDSRVESVKDSDRLLWVKQAVNPQVLPALHSVDWCRQACLPETANRFLLIFESRIQIEINQELRQLIPEINELTGQRYREIDATWYLCKSDYVSVMHTDGKKTNLLLIYWQVPGPQYGTTFYNSADYGDVYHEFPGQCNTGFFANYEPAPGEPWPKMWHASPVPVPPGSHRLISQHTLHR